MPHTVRLPVWARNPAASAQNVRNDGAVNNGRKQTSRAISEAGSCTVGAGSIGAHLRGGKRHADAPFIMVEAARTQDHPACRADRDMPRRSPPAPGPADPGGQTPI